jgi:Kef-type K+ transport system membrane component KefB/nucleotide-binding universal stress UspA family protein
LEALIQDPLTRFIAQVIAIVVVSRLLGIATRRIGQPMVIAETIAGILLGPSLLGLIWPEFTGVLFAPASLGGLQLVSQLGLVLFMFLVGLELDPKLLKGRGHASIVISQLGIIVPFGLGALLAFYLYPRVSQPQVAFPVFAFFVGIAMSITAFPVLARILAERRLLRSRVGAMTIACAAVDDLTAWCLLAFVVAAARAKGIEGAVQTTLLALGYVIVMLLIVRPLLARLGARVGTSRELTQNVVAAIMLLLFASSWATELIGIHALFGAFTLGVILPKDGGLGHALAEKLEDLVLVVLLPLFFAYSGVRTQIGLLDSASSWITAGVIIVVACIGKFGGSTIAARMTGMSWRESGALGILMNTRGLMELIVLNIGLDLGVISPMLFTMMVLMALFTTFITTPILNRVYPPDQFARDLLAMPQPNTSQDLVPPPFTILMCVANDRSGPGLVVLAGALGTGLSRIHALHLIHPAERVSSVMEQTAEEHASDSAFVPMLERAREMNLRVKTTAFVSGEPADDICSVAQVKAADLVLMGWHKPVFSQTMLGGVVYDVMNGVDCDVAAFLDRGLQKVQRVLLPFIGTTHDQAALRLSKRFVDAGAEVTLLHVKKPDEETSTVRHAADQVFKEPSGGMVNILMAYDREPLEVALKESANGYDLLVVGLGRDWGLEQRRVGVAPERLMNDCPISVLVVRGSNASADAPVEGRVEATV